MLPAVFVPALLLAGSWGVACASVPAGSVPPEPPVRALPDPAAALEEDTAPSRAPGPAVESIPPALLQAARDARGKTFPERMGAVSKVLLGRPYVNDPMGEGKAPDADPIARFDAFDCLTFAEEVLAWSFASDPAAVAEVRKSLRYGDGSVDYAHRRHFMELQWIPGTVRDGWLRVTTAEYGRVETLRKTVDADTWKRWSSRPRFQMTDAELPVGQMSLDVLPLDEAVRVAPTIRPGSLILTVREDRAGVPIWITHVSVLVPDGAGGTVLRHATKIGEDDRVKDHGFTWYVEHLRSYTNWTVKGIAILEPVPQDVDAP
jgi:hypothetical protein